MNRMNDKDKTTRLTDLLYELNMLIEDAITEKNYRFIVISIGQLNELNHRLMKEFKELSHVEVMHDIKVE